MPHHAPIALRVECYAGFRAEERPTAFWLGECRVAVRDIVKCWLDEDHAYFQVTGEDGMRYTLRRDDRHDRWQLVLTEVPAPPSMEARG